VAVDIVAQTHMAIVEPLAVAEGHCTSYSTHTVDTAAATSATLVRIQADIEACRPPLKCLEIGVLRRRRSLDIRAMLRFEQSLVLKSAKPRAAYAGIDRMR